MKNQSGFTLFEILVAIFVLTFLMVSVISITNDSTNTKEQVVKEDKEFLQIETAMARLEWDISHLYSPLYFSKPMQPTGEGRYRMNPEKYANLINSINDRFGGNDNFSGVSDDGKLIPRFVGKTKESFQFFTLANRRKMSNIKQSHFAWVKYDLVSGEESQKNLVRYFKADNPYDPYQWDTSKTKPQVLLKNVTELIFEYWNPDRKKYETSLESMALKDGPAVIRAVKVTIEWIDSEGIENQMVRIFRPLFPNLPIEDMTTPANNSPSTRTRTGTDLDGEPVE
jgi:hypothetical protein